MPKKFTCPGCKKQFILAGLEEAQIKMANKAVEKFAEKILEIFNSHPESSFTNHESSAILKECIDKVLEIRQKANSIVQKGSAKKLLRKVFSPFTS